jgi:F-type H+-transporting ATPase subunit gamma
MEAISAVKMRRSVALAIASRPFVLSALKILRDIRAKQNGENIESPYFLARPVKQIICAIITSDKGMAGRFNRAVLETAEKLIISSAKPVKIFAIGKKARDYFRSRNLLIDEFLGAGDFGALEETKPISRRLSHYFLTGAADEIKIIYTNFHSAFRQEVVTRTILPLAVNTIEEIAANIKPERGPYQLQFEPLTAETDPGPVILEPTPSVLLAKLSPALVEIIIHQSILEANASEHSARMMAMKNASDNAADLLDNLLISYNKNRQAQITKELIEITAGKEALEA